MIKTTVKKYVEMALQEKIWRESPNYPNELAKKVIDILAENTVISKDIVYRAIELALESNYAIKDHPAICKDCEQYAGDCEFCGYKE